MLARNNQDSENFIVFGVVNTFRYTNYEGVTEMRRIIPLHLRWGTSEHHANEQWLVECIAIDRDMKPRTFALSSIIPQ